ncbi:sensor histidine kinase [Roseicyclus persicicus]|uniref:histidine kinase n=1 Tax=Roseicyclus persicicus TaxID=2650661 RepID=A0A7X6GY26_9RHOB|nr:sensor histidine kinase [Roseibacterium persicicum]NKX44522.1 sensor histidine kinase [Roseibacterium persicicum]
MRAATSLRLRLTAIILVPLLSIALAVGFWQVHDAREKAADIFDRSLLTVALAVTGDVARSNGNALSLETRDLLGDTSGGPVFYHVYAPNGYYVTGYATPPVRHAAEPWPDEPYTYYNSTYHGDAVRALRLRDVTTVDGITGLFTITVWQHVEVRDAVVRDLARRAFIVMAILIGTVAFVVWFGVRIGLRPLTDLEDAISRRSGGDLSPIRRPVPPEIRGLVLRLNTLFGQVEASMARQASFISNAAHQLRNPIAGVLAMAEAVRSAPSDQAARDRAGELLVSARHVKDLANKLLTLERATTATGHDERLEVGELLEDVTDRFRATARAQGVALSLALPEDEVLAEADPVMLREAVANLVDNALRHGGPDLGRVAVGLSAGDGLAQVTVADDGRGVAAEDVETVLSRFGQAGPSEGSGLGLSIAEAVAERHGGAIALAPSEGGGLLVTLTIPAAVEDGAPMRQAAE